jgi:hypothetical protein
MITLKQFFKSKDEFESHLDIMAKSDVETLYNLALNNSEDVQKRCLVIQKVNDLNILYKLLNDPNNQEVQNIAKQRWQGLINGKLDESSDISLQYKLSHVEQIDIENLLMYISKQASDSEVRAVAFNKINNEDLYADIAINDNFMQNRLTAIRKINNPKILIKVSKDVRNRDKRIYRIAKERLNVLNEELEKPTHIREQYHDICKRIDYLFKAAEWEKSYIELEILTTKWNNLEVPVDKDLEQHFQKSRQKFLDARESVQKFNKIRIEKHQQYDKLQTLLNKLVSYQKLTEENSHDITNNLAIIEKNWHNIAKLEEAEEQEIQIKFEKTCENIRTKQRTLQHYQNISEALSNLCQEAENLLNSKNIITKNIVTNLQKSWQAIEHPPGNDELLNTYKVRFKQAIEKLLSEQDNKQQKQQNSLKTLNKNFEELNEFIEQGKLQKANDAEKIVCDLLKTSSISKAEYNSLEARLHKFQAKIHELQDWQRWGNKREREKLCETVEAMTNDKDTSPELIAKQIKEIQDNWKKLHQKDNSNALWRRFNNACHSAYEPCREHFKQQAQERRNNKELKESIVQQLETYVSELENNIGTNLPESELLECLDYKSINSFIQKHSKNWYKIGPTDRKQKKILKEKFDSLNKRLDKYLSPARTAGLTRRKQLVEQAEELSSCDSNNFSYAIREAKNLQEEWKNIVSGSRREEQKLWKKFHNACDMIFERKNKLDSDILTAKNKLCEKLELLSASDDENDLPIIATELKNSSDVWADLDRNSNRRAPKNLSNRFKKAKQQLKYHYHDLQIKLQCKQINELAKKSLLCIALERNEDTQEQVQKSWDILDILENNEFEQLIGKRFNQACKSANNKLSDNLDDKLNILCIRMEMSADIESPKHARQARMAYKIQSLANAMKGVNIKKNNAINEIQQIEAEWYLNNIAVDKPCLERFEHARQAYYRKLLIK